MAKTGRKAGGRNFNNISAADNRFEQFIPQNEADKTVEVQEEHETILPEIFTTINKDFIRIDDLMAASGLAYDTCSRIIREIKSISDTFQISGTIHRTDYYAYIRFRLNRQEVTI